MTIHSSHNRHQVPSGSYPFREEDHAVETVSQVDVQYYSSCPARQEVRCIASVSEYYIQYIPQVHFPSRTLFVPIFS